MVVRVVAHEHVASTARFVTLTVRHKAGNETQNALVNVERRMHRLRRALESSCAFVGVYGSSVLRSSLALASLAFASSLPGLEVTCCVGTRARAALDALCFNVDEHLPNGTRDDEFRQAVDDAPVKLHVSLFDHAGKRRCHLHSLLLCNQVIAQMGRNENAYAGALRKLHRLLAQTSSTVACIFCIFGLRLCCWFEGRFEDPCL